MPVPVATLYPDWPPYDGRLRGVTVTHPRASVLNRLCSHDAFHAGEISQLLGLHGLPESISGAGPHAEPRATR